MSHLISSKKKRTAGVTETERTKMRKISHFRKFCNLHSLKIENYDSLQLKSFLKKMPKYRVKYSVFTKDDGTGIKQKQGKQDE